MCQQKKSNYLFGLKHIFKQSELMTPLFMSVYSSLNFLMNIDHSSIASVYKTVEDKDKISVFQEYLPTLLYDELMSKKRLSIETIRRYLKQIIEAVVILHENNRFHGNLTPLQIGCNMEVCKVRVSITTIASKHP